MKIFTALTADSLISCDSPDCVVVIDVLRSGASAAAALSSGATGVKLIADPAEARQVAAATGAVLAGERDCVRLDGFHLGNSPGEFTSERVQGKPVVLCTTNGPRAFSRFTSCPNLLYASRCNESATVEAVRRISPQSLAIICAGTAGLVSLEDIVVAGAIIAQMGKPETLDDASELAFRAYTEYASDDEFRAALPTFEGAKKLVALGYSDDIIYCGCRDIFPFAVVFEHRKGAFVRSM